MPVSFSADSADHHSTWVHRLDVRTKMGMAVLASVAVLMINHPVPLGVSAAVAALYALSLKRYRIVFILHALLAAMGAAAVAMMAGVHALWPQTESLDLITVVVPFLRTLVVINVSLALALSSSAQSLMATLKTVRLPFSIYVPLAVMIRFVPAFIEDVRQIAECMRTRGHSVTAAAVIARPGLTIRLLLMPMLFRSLRSADELGIAAELKGLGAATRLTAMRALRFHRSDLLAAVLTFSVLAAAIALQVILGDGLGGVYH
jgi:energy-coupling factor transport system permease protein